MTSHHLTDQVKIIVYVLSGIVSTALVLMTWNVQNDNERITHRLDVDDAWQLKGVYEAGKDWQSEAQELRAFADRIIEHCRKDPKCDLPDGWQMPPSRNPPAMELMVSRVKTQQEK